MQNPNKPEATVMYLAIAAVSFVILFGAYYLPVYITH